MKICKFCKARNKNNTIYVRGKITYSSHMGYDCEIHKYFSGSKLQHQYCWKCGKTIEWQTLDKQYI